jgi:hypothetical protein
VIEPSDWKAHLLGHIAEELEERSARFLEGAGEDGEDATPADFGLDWEGLARQQEELRRELHALAEELRRH